MHRLLSLAAVLALAACSSAAPTAATTPTPSAAVITADPTPSATVTATPTPTVWSKEQAGAKYLEIVAPSNAALSAVQAQAKATPRTASKIAPLCDTYAGTLKAFLDALAGGLWPADRSQRGRGACGLGQGMGAG